MHFRTDSRSLSGGKRRTYLSLAHNVWVSYQVGSNDPTYRASFHQ